LHDLQKRTMILGKILQLVVSEVAAQPDRGEYQDLPKAHAVSSYVRGCVAQDILADQFQGLVPEIGSRIQMLQTTQDGNHRSAAFTI
jgi:hypothetical protein